MIEGFKNDGKSTAFYVDEKNFTLVTPSKTKSEGCDSLKLSLRVFIYYKGSKVRDSLICQ